MNEQIKLPAQEWLGYDPEKGDLHGYTFEQMREFAELIVKECSGVNYHSSFQDGEFHARELLDHFGVGE